MKKSSFSFIELSLFLVFLTLLSSLLTLHLPKVLFWQRSNQEREALKTLFQVANDWVLFSDSDLCFKFSSSKEKLEIEVHTPSKDLKLPFTQKSSFSTFESLSFLDLQKNVLKEISLSSPSSHTLELCENGGLQEPQYLFFKSKTRPSLTLFFPGYPHVVLLEK